MPSTSLAPVTVPVAPRVRVAPRRRNSVSEGGAERSAEERAHLRAVVLQALPAIEWWCGERKAVWLADLVADNGCSMVLDIGTYGGGSLIPMALAVQRRVPAGRVYGVEAWSSGAGREAGSDAANDTWWRDVELGAVKSGFLRSLLDNDLAAIVTVLEMSPDEALACLTATGAAGFDLIHLGHLGGCRSEKQALGDVKAWSALLRPRGILVLGDIAAPSMQPALTRVTRAFSVLDEVAEAEGAAYGAYRRRT